MSKADEMFKEYGKEFVTPIFNDITTRILADIEELIVENEQYKNNYHSSVKQLNNKIRKE